MQVFMQDVCFQEVMQACLSAKRLIGARPNSRYHPENQRITTI
jgi:hypothetical protein